MKKEKICVYTAITGNYDTLKEIKKEPGIDYYCFTNNKDITSNSWKIIYLEDSNLSNVQLARKIKILGHPSINQYDILLWMDGAVCFQTKIKDFIENYLNDTDVFVAFKHGERKTVYEEAISCIRYKKETKEKIQALLQFYKTEKYKDNNGLIESTVYIKRPKDSVVQETMKLWFQMVETYTTRDQLSFNYCISKTGLKVKWISEKVFSNKWFQWHNHKKNQQIKRYRIYFGEEENYQVENDIQGDYIIQNKKYSFEVTSPVTTNHTIIEVTDVPCVFFDHLKIKNIKEKDYILYNYIDYKKRKVFYNQNAVLLITKELKQGDTLQFEIELEPLKKEEKEELIEYLSIENIKDTYLKEHYQQLQEELDRLRIELVAIKNSRTYKIMEPFRFLKKSLKKLTNRD